MRGFCENCIEKYMFQKQMGDCRLKLARFGRPVDLDTRLDRTNRILRDVEQGLDILRVQSDSCEDVLTLLDRAEVMILFFKYHAFCRLRFTLP